MDPARWQRLRSLFEAAGELPEAELEPFLARACAGDEGLLRELRGMLRAEPEGPAGPGSAGFLEPLPAGTPAAARAPRSGTRVGAFRLGAVLAAGGMGTVYEAEQDDPRRKVALKILRRGLADPSALRRFRFEAELLAKLRHPGIAPVYEAGVHTAEDGSEVPFLAMELVEGARDVLTFARDEGLDQRARIELFLQVLAAAQHGHQQVVVHRDLKPHNILVDREGRARIIDFGIARAVGQASGLADLEQPETQLTGQGEILGTLGYMSPEQFSGDSGAIDTRSDVYSLGVVLHELLCGRSPLDLAGRSLLEISRVVTLEPVPPPPELPSDLGWVLVKALAKEPEARYAAASEFAADLGRFLADEPVEAGAPSATYRLRKFVRRYRLPVAFAGLAAAALVVGTIAALVGLSRAKQAQVDLADQRDVAVAEADRFESLFDVLSGMLFAVSPDQDGRQVRVADVLDRAATELAELERPEVAGVMHQVLGQSYRNLGLRPEALEQLERSLELLAPLEDTAPALLAEVRADLAAALLEVGRSEDALALVELGLSEARAALAEGEPAVFALEAAHAGALLRMGRVDEALQTLPERVAVAEATLGDDAAPTRALRGAWSSALRQAGELRAAREVQAENVVRARRALGERDPQTLGERLALAEIREDLGQWEQVVPELGALLPDFERTFGRASGRTCSLMSQLAEALTDLGRNEEAYALLLEALPCLEAALDPSSATLQAARGNMASVLQQLGDRVGALELRRAAWEAAERYFGADDPRALAHAHSTAVLLESLGENGEALAIAERVARLRREALGAESERTLEALEIVSKSLIGLGEFERAHEVTSELLDARTRLRGPDDPRTLRVHNELTTLLAYSGRFEEALAEGERMLAIHRRALPDEDPSRTTLLGNMGMYARRHGQPELAVDYHREAYELASSVLPPGDTRRAIAALDLGEALAMVGEQEDAHELLLEAVETLRRTPGSNPELRGRAHGNLGVVLWHLGELEEARGQLELGVGFYERSGDVSTRQTLEDLLRQLEQALAEHGD